MTCEDLEEVLALEARAFDDPWTEQNLGGELAAKHASVHLATDEVGRILGYIVHWVVVDEATILRVAVDPHARRQGLGRRLLAQALTHAQAAGCITVTLEVRRSNRAAIALYASAGFVAQAVREAYYKHGNEDAIVMQLRF